MGADLLFTLRLADPIINTSPLHPVRGQTLLHKLFVLFIGAICIIFSETVAAPTSSDLEHLNQHMYISTCYKGTPGPFANCHSALNMDRTEPGNIFTRITTHTQISARFSKVQVSEQFKVCRGPTDANFDRPPPVG